MGAVYLEIDASQVVDLANQLAKQIGSEKAQKILNRTIWKTGKTMKTPIAKALGTVYTAKASWIKGGILAPRMETDVCVIPLSGHRGPIGRVFKRGGGKRHPKAGIIKGQMTPLPAVMAHQGGNPPFRSGAGVATTSASGKHPRVVGLAVPQMPLPAAKGNAPVEQVIEEKMLHIMERSCHEILGGYV